MVYKVPTSDVSTSQQSSCPQVNMTSLQIAFCGLLLVQACLGATTLGYGSGTTYGPSDASPSAPTTISYGYSSNSYPSYTSGHYPPPSPMPCAPGCQMRLVGGRGDNEGRVEIRCGGATGWGTVCDDSWDDNDAAVVCRQLGLTGGVAFGNAIFGSGWGQIAMDDVECEGIEESLITCRYTPAHNCMHHEDASVCCGDNCTRPDSTTYPPWTTSGDWADHDHSHSYYTTGSGSWGDSTHSYYTTGSGSSGGSPHPDYTTGSGSSGGSPHPDYTTGSGSSGGSPHPDYTTGSGSGSS